MKNLNFIEKYEAIRLIDHSKATKIFNKNNRALTSFAIDDAITTSVGDKDSLPTIRLWQHPRTLVLGIPDTRLPYIDQAVQFIKDNRTEAVIRNSGGLAVLLDPGVLNISMIIPNDRLIDIHDGYNMMYQLIQDLFESETDKIEAYEIVGSYCPGDYDLSIDGVKFAGISQRRIRNGIAVQIYLDIEGESPERAAFVKQFYHIGKKDIPTKFDYPNIIPSKMGTISYLTQREFTVETVKSRLKHMLSPQIRAEDLSDQEAEIFTKRYAQMIKRNEKI